ncbi:hypothetical protein NL50_17820 [Clostridium acetobutylicum]|nr:hypothetical protein NL50_17820 [Clostridium acetobutylicum]
MDLKNLARNKGYTLTQLSVETNISLDYLSKLNKGKKDNPTRDVMEKISKTLGITLDELNKSLKISESKVN